MCSDLEVQIKESHKSLEESLEKIIQLEKQVTTKDKEIEDVRTRITEVAEIFERKDINHRYSFDVLCDFIYDKAKRLFAKFDNAMKELKSISTSG